MLENSKDLINVSLSFGIVLLAVMFAFVLYYVVKILKDASDMVHEVRDTVAEFKNHLRAWEEFLDLLKERLSHASTYLPLIVDAISKIVEFAGKKKEKNKNKSQ